MKTKLHLRFIYTFRVFQEGTSDNDTKSDSEEFQNSIQLETVKIVQTQEENLDESFQLSMSV